MSQTKLNNSDKILCLIMVGLGLYVLGNMYAGEFIDMMREFLKHLFI